MKLLYKWANDWKAKALVMVLKDTGLRVSDVVKLDVGDVRDGRPPVAVKIRQEKTGFQAIPFIGEEAVDAVNQLLRSREQVGNDEPLFVNVEGRTRAIRIVKLAASKAGLEKISAHSLRKFARAHRCKTVNESGSIRRLVGR